jgi:YhcH/YjgK/YiaL family protein
MIFDNVKNASLYSNISSNLKAALNYMQNNDLNSFENGRFEIADGNVTVIIKKGYNTKEEEQCKWESHQKYIDIQYLLEGQEQIGYCKTLDMEVKVPYDEETDKILYHNCDKHFKTKLEPGDFIILFPDDSHKTLIAGDKVTTNNKAVIKVLI